MLAKIKYTFIVADTFLNMCEKIHRFLSSIKRDAYKRKLVPFFLPHGVYLFLTIPVIATISNLMERCSPIF